MTLQHIDISWKGLQEFPNFAGTCPRCSDRCVEKPKSHCRWNAECCVNVISVDGSHNNIQSIVPERLQLFRNLQNLDLSSNRLKELPEEIFLLPQLRQILATNNKLSSLPKTIASLENLEVLNLSGNAFGHIPPTVFEITCLRSLHFGGNKIEEVPPCIVNLQNLEVLYLGGNHIQSIPAEVGEMKNLSSLVLCDNRLSSIPVELVRLRNLRSLSLHNNQLLYLPREILELVNLVELSLRGNPMVIRFVQDMSCDPPSLVELASRVIKRRKLKYDDLPKSLVIHLNSAKKCPNAQCSGVYFHPQYHQIKFVDFCGKYRLPLMQYLCSPRCISYSSASSAASSETESEEELDEARMRRVLLG